MRGYYGEIWKIDSNSGSYFAKTVSSKSHRILYERSFPVMEYINQQGIAYISKTIKTSDGRLFTDFNGTAFGMFEWIDGENIQNERTKIEEYRMLCGIYAISKIGLDIPVEDFSLKHLDLFNQFRKKCGAKITGLFEQHRDKINHCSNRLKLFSSRCINDKSNFYITHGDAGGNIIVNGNDYYLVDWDDPMYAPPERDAWFCLHWDWAVNEFNTCLKNNGINYILRRERLAYYCYNSFFWYLTLYLKSYFEINNEDEIYNQLIDYISGDCWIEDNIKYADTIK